MLLQAKRLRKSDDRSQIRYETEARDLRQFTMEPGDNTMKGGAEFSRNNLDCLRVILASIVVLFHMSALTALPAFNFLGKYCSPHFAVRSFFVISGMLIYQSYSRSSSISSYFEKRVRRIYPAYFTTIVIAALALSFLSSLPPSVYFGSGFWKYLGANLVFLNFLAPSLPGVFTANNLNAVDGALWTLKIEVVFYISVPLFHYLCNRFGTKITVGTIFVLSSIWKYGFYWLGVLHSASSTYAGDAPRNIYEKLDVQFPSQLVYFLSGVLLLLYFDKLKTHFRTILAITAVLYATDHFFTGELLDVFWISGLVFVFGFWRYLGKFAKYGDFSYGLYIVHWPILQIFIALGATQYSPAVFFLMSTTTIVLTSVLMWKLVESRFLGRSNHYHQESNRATA
jgi:peptidoglycan/LPS O-acetylase OafA/YrhL